MTLEEFIKWIATTEETYKYQLLSRMQQDCTYFLGYGNGCIKHLWGGTIDEHIEFMKTLHSIITEKPEWLTIEEIGQFKQDMNRK